MSQNLDRIYEDQSKEVRIRPCLLGMAEEQMQQLRSQATELLLREEWQQSIQVYTQFVHLCRDEISKTHENPDQNLIFKLYKSICLALSNRAEARSRMRDFTEALRDCDEALKIESTHFKTLLCKGKILLALNRYSSALDCFKMASLDQQENENLELINGFLEKCKRLELQSRSGAFDLSNWILNGFQGKSPELADYIGAVQIKKSDLSGRGLFATKNIDTGTLLIVTKATATERGILSGQDSAENVQLVMWKNFVDKVTESTTKCQRTCQLVSTLSTGEIEETLEVPDLSLFRPEAEENVHENEKLDIGTVLSILDVNSLVEDSVSANIFGKNCGYYGVGLWLLPSYINHSCKPNARRLHIGDYIIVHASRDVKAGEEITFAYFDVLSPLDRRKEMLETWGFSCNCKRCKFEEAIYCEHEIREIEMDLERGIDVGSAIFKLEGAMRRCMVRGKEKGYLRASFWAAYSEAYGSERTGRKWGRQIPTIEAVVDSVVKAVGSDDRILKVVVEGLKKRGGQVMEMGMGMEMERAMKLGRGLYGKVARKQAMKCLLELNIH